MTAKKGTKLYFMCLIHPWMQAKVDVTLSRVVDRAVIARALAAAGALALVRLAPGAVRGDAAAADVDYWVAAVPTTWNIVPERARRDHGHADRPARTRSSRRSSTAATAADWRKPLPNAPRVERRRPADPRAR